MTRTLSKADQKLLDQAVQEVSTGMLATKVLREAQSVAGPGGDLDRAYIKLRFRQLRKESARQLRRVARLREQAGALADNTAEIRIRRSVSDPDRGVVDDDGIRVSRRRKGKSKWAGFALTALALVFFCAVGVALFQAF